MADSKNVYVDSKGLLSIVQGDLRNEYILYSGRGGESAENPLPMLTYREHGKYFLKVSDDGLVVAAASFYPYAKGADKRYPHDDSMYLSQVSVHKDHRKNGYAKDLLNSVFALASKTNSVLRLSDFKPDGRKYLAPILPNIHHRYPDAKVLYDGELEPVTGKDRYKLVLEIGKPQIQPL